MRNLIVIIFAVHFTFSCEASSNPCNYKTHTPKPATLVHVLTLNPKKVKIVAVRAQDIGHGLANVESMARYFNAIAAINGGFFRLEPENHHNGVPAGVLKINNDWHGIAYKARGAIAWEPGSNNVLIDIIQTDSKVILQNKKMQINAMNRLAFGNRASLLSDSYTNIVDVANSTAIVIANSRVEAVYASGKIDIPKNAYVYNIAGALQAQVQNIQPNDTAVMQINVQPILNNNTIKKWNSMPFILGGGPILVSNGKKNTDFTKEYVTQDFITKRHARTAVGILPDKRWVLVVAEQNQLQDIVGLSIPELAEFMHSIGCIDAINLDGGGSSAMYIAGIRHNLISLELVADALLVLPVT